MRSQALEITVTRPSFGSKEDIDNFLKGGKYVICIKCGKNLREHPNQFCHKCISDRAEEIHMRSEKANRVANWFRAIEELKYEVQTI